MEEIIFIIEEDNDGGYNARALGLSIFTQGETIDELKANILDAVSCHFDDHIKRIIRLHFVKDEILQYA